jgi:anti-sigma regulatory factor (Ser/Thr protein kinase)
MENFQTLNDFVRSCAGMADFSDDAISRILLATEEIFVNIVHYAYDGSAPGGLEIKCNCRPDGALELRFIDQGREFDPLQVKGPDTAAPIEQRRIGGLGIFLAKNLVDSIQYQRVGQSNILTLIKNKG